jgi:hypothetical protein
MADDELCSCEKVAHGELGPVQNEERLARIVTDSGRHQGKDGKFKPGLFPIVDIREKGVSLMRADHMNAATMEMHAAAIAGALPNRAASGIAICIAKVIREVVDPDNGKRSLCVVDDPVKDEPPFPDNPAHAIAIRSGDQDQPELLRLQGILVALFGGLLNYAGAPKAGG